MILVPFDYPEWLDSDPVTGPFLAPGAPPEVVAAFEVWIKPWREWQAALREM